MPRPTPAELRGKTPRQKRAEAAEAANQPEPASQPDATDSAEAESVTFTVEDVPPGDDAGDIVDAEVVEPAGNVVDIADAKKRDREDKAKNTPPRIDEWQDWFSRVIIKAGTDYYLTLAFNGIEEEALSAREVQAITLTPSERDRIAKPFAELANKLKWTRKHGRAIVASTGALEALLTLGQWFSRVNRIARKYHKQNYKAQNVTGEVIPPNEHPRPNPPPGTNGAGTTIPGARFYNPGSG